MADPVERYLELGLRLGRHDEDLIDAYYGPDELARRVEAEELREPAALAEDADALAEELAGDEWLAAQVARARRERPQARRRAARLRRGGPARLRDRAPLARRGAVPPGGRDPRRGAAGRAATLRERYARWFERDGDPGRAGRAGGARRGRRAAAADAGGDRPARRRGVRARARHRRALARLRPLPRRPAHPHPGQHRPAAAGGRPRARSPRTRSTAATTRIASGRRPSSCAGRGSWSARSTCSGRPRRSSRRESR